MATCIDTGEKIDPKLAYVVLSENSKGKTVKKYYSSKEGYEKYTYDNKYRRKCTDLIMEYMGYKPKMKLPTLTFKLVEEYKDPIGFDVLYETLLSQRNNIEYAFRNKDFGGDIARIQYLFAIIQNSYGEFWRKKVAQERENRISDENHDPNEYDESRERRQAVRDIIQFLDDE